MQVKALVCLPFLPLVSGYPTYNDPGTSVVPSSPAYKHSGSVTRFNVEDGKEGKREVEYFFASDARLDTCTLDGGGGGGGGGTCLCL